jgi:hypothetical protein
MSTKGGIDVALGNPTPLLPLLELTRASQTPTASDGRAVGDETRRRAMIAEAAYYLAEHRSFAPGHELDDWCRAEREIDSLLTAGGRRAA